MKLFLKLQHIWLTAINHKSESRWLGSKLLSQHYKLPTHWLFFYRINRHKWRCCCRRCRPFFPVTGYVQLWTTKRTIVRTISCCPLHIHMATRNAIHINNKWYRNCLKINSHLNSKQQIFAFRVELYCSAVSSCVIAEQIIAKRIIIL